MMKSKESIPLFPIIKNYFFNSGSNFMYIKRKFRFIVLVILYRLAYKILTLMTKGKENIFLKVI